MFLNDKLAVGVHTDGADIGLPRTIGGSCWPERVIRVRFSCLPWRVKPQGEATVSKTVGTRCV